MIECAAAPAGTSVPGASLRTAQVELVAGAAALAFLGVYAWVYYLERTATADSAFFS